MKTVISKVSLHHLTIRGARIHVLSVEITSVDGRHTHIRHHLPPDTSERTQKRITTLLEQIADSLQIR
ncbi:hypothetical protein GJV11_11380 [Enterobacteriaceae bacterium RIT693]|jgi:hypothetical protein|nr:hypothetical protein [Enterobacteriaceae bacterium RIT693]